MSLYCNHTIKYQSISIPFRKNREAENNAGLSHTKVISLLCDLTSSAVQPLRLREVEARLAVWAGAKAAAEAARREATTNLYMMDGMMALTRETENEK